jgi:hypothetical protein
MQSTLSVTTAASSLALLTLEELRAAAGDSAATDIELLAMGLRIAAAVMSECNIAVGSGAEPTLLRETLTETFYWPRRIDLVLSRRHNIVISSVTADGSVVAAADYIVDPESGILTRISGGYPCHWGGQTIVVVYQAGFSVVPGDLKAAALDFFRASLNESGRDPFVKSESTEIPGVETKRFDYWVGSVPGSSDEGAVPDIVAGQLKRFRNMVMA